MRALGSLEMSVGTSLAFEGELINQINRTDSVSINLRTLVRNAHEAYEKDDKEAFDVERVSKDVESDIVLIGKWLEANRKARPITMSIYLPTYRDLNSRFPKATLWTPTTDKQKKKEALIKGVTERLAKKYSKHITLCNSKLPDFQGNGIVLTHHVVDLIDINGTGRLHLLESYTGVLKPFTAWHTKLTNGGDLYNIPFNRLTIQVFGDKSTNFASSSHGIKELVKRIAKDGSWTSASTLSRVRGSINNWPNPIDRAGLLLMLG